MAISGQTQYEGYKTEANAKATRVGIKVKAKASKVEASIGSMRPLHNRGRSLYDVDGPLVGQWRRPMKQRRLRQGKSEMPLVVHAGTRIFMRYALAVKGQKYKVATQSIVSYKRGALPHVKGEVGEYIYETLTVLGSTIVPTFA